MTRPKLLMEKPSNLLVKLSRRLFEDENDRAQFLQRLTQPQPFNPCILWRDSKPEVHPFEVVERAAWQPEFVDRLAVGEKPGQHSLHQAGAFYCLDFSSVFAASVLLTIPPGDRTVLDVCASPGGKSLFAWVSLQPKQLFSNEVIGKRTGALISNLKRCRIHPAIVLRLDSKVLAETLPRSMNVVLVDAPCTGQSLLAKGGKAPGCFHPVTINTNANRQKRILANSAQLVAPGGYLVYMTCTYSPEENEQVVEWLLERFPNFQPVPVPHLAAHQSHLSPLPCYRMFPQQGWGAGAFTVLLRNVDSGNAAAIPSEFFDRPGLTVL